MVPDPQFVIPIRTPGKPVSQSFAQERIFWFERLVGSLPIHNIPAVIAIMGDLDVSALERALCEVVERHEALRTSFCFVQGAALQEVIPSCSPKFTVADLRTVPVGNRRHEVESAMEMEALQPFDLTQGPLLRCRLLILHQRHHMLLITAHHIASDAWSMAILARETAEFYKSLRYGNTPMLPTMSVQYGDFAMWQRAAFQNGLFRSQVDFWEKRRHGSNRLPSDPEIDPGLKRDEFESDIARFELGPLLTKLLIDFAACEHTTLFVVLWTAFHAFLFRVIRIRSAGIGVPVACRTQPETECIIGLFAKVVPLYLTVNANECFRALVKQAHNFAMECFDNLEAPTLPLLPWIEWSSASGIEKARVTFALQDIHVLDVTFPGLSLALCESHNGFCPFELMWFVQASNPAPLRGYVISRRKMFTSADVNGMIAGFIQTLEFVLLQPDVSLEN
jgi:Condensation domain